MDALLALQSSLHCLALFCSAIADWDKARSPATAAHTAKVGFITHISGKFRPTATAPAAPPARRKLPRWRPQCGPQPLTGSSALFAVRSRLVKNKERTEPAKKAAPRGAAVAFQLPAALCR